MSWQWLIFVVVLLLGNFLCLGSMIIGLANPPAVLVSGDINFRGTSRYTFGSIIAFIFQSIIAVTLSAAILSYFLYITTDNRNMIMWLIGIVGAIYPMWQTWSLARRERIHEPESYIVKEATHKAVPFAFIVTVIFTAIFVSQPEFLSSVFYWFVGLAVFVICCGLISFVLVLRRNSRPVI